MANNYRQFSENFQLLSQDEANWFEKKFNLTDDEDNNNSFFIDYTISDDILWIGCEDFCEMDRIAKIFFEFLNLYRKDRNDIFTLTWADFCSKLRVREFGGGFIFVCKDYFVVQGTDDLVEKEVENYKTTYKTKTDTKYE